MGSLLLHFMIGSGNTFANLNTYITSYLRENGSKDANYGQSVWYTAVGVTTFTLLTIFSGFIVKKIGTRITCLFGTLILWFVNYILIIITTN
jgi:MFS family permease